MEMDLYKITNTAHEAIHDWIDKTVDASWKALATEGSTGREIIQALRRNVSQSDVEIIARASRAYLDALKAAYRSIDP